MHHFFADTENISDGNVRITGTDVNHMKNALRIRPGEEVLISDGTGRDYKCVVSGVEEDMITLSIEEESSCRTELPVKLYLFQGLPKGDRMEIIIQKAAELGAYEIIPVDMKRSVVRLDDKKKESRIRRYNAISESAAKQSKRSIVPKVRDIMSFREAVEYASQFDLKIIPYENYKDMKETAELLSDMSGIFSIAIFIGPEGGFDGEEVNLAVENGIKPVSLGRRILRTETAGIAALSILMYLTETRCVPERHKSV